MPTRDIDDPLFDLLSYARPGPGRRDRLTPAQVRQIARTVGRTPEVMVKVLSRGAGDLGAVRRHVDYIGRKGDVQLETDDGQTLSGEHVRKSLIDDWDLDLDGQRTRADLMSRPGRQPPRLVHKLVFSMPAGTSPEKVLDAVRNLCREEFGLKHRYVMALHTDEPHPHVHVVLKAVNEQGKRLNIRKATLREWRAQFAGHLRGLGVPANATQRYVRGQTRLRKPDPIYRAELRDASTHVRQRAQAVAQEPAEGTAPGEAGKTKILATHHKVQRAWRALSDTLARERHRDLAEQVRRFANQMPTPVTEREWIARKLDRTQSPHMKWRSSR